jgi:hypothetical protein
VISDRINHSSLTYWWKTACKLFLREHITSDELELATDWLLEVSSAFLERGILGNDLTVQISFVSLLTILQHNQVSTEPY